uniref:Uncharacterized protein n=1 Tax=Anguilla anguilla TaxID=7936 RepID=A0A0E9UKH3_ANGAN
MEIIKAHCDAIYVSRSLYCHYCGGIMVKWSSGTEERTDPQ